MYFPLMDGSKATLIDFMQQIYSPFFKILHGRWQTRHFLFLIILIILIFFIILHCSYGNRLAECPIRLSFAYVAQPLFRKLKYCRCITIFLLKVISIPLLHMYKKKYHSKYASIYDCGQVGIQNYFFRFGQRLSCLLKMSSIVEFV